MKRFLISIALLLGMSAIFISCNKDSAGTPIGSYPQKIIGTWDLVKTEYFSKGEVTGSIPNIDGVYYTFKEDGKVSMFIKIANSSYPPTNYEYSYSLSGSQLSIQSEIKATYDIVRITDTDMIWQEDFNTSVPVLYDKVVMTLSKRSAIFPPL